MLLEFADKGNLEQAIQQKRFALRSDPSQLDMVSTELRQMQQKLVEDELSCLCTFLLCCCNNLHGAFSIL